MTTVQLVEIWVTNSSVLKTTLTRIITLDKPPKLLGSNYLAIIKTIQTPLLLLNLDAYLHL